MNGSIDVSVRAPVPPTYLGDAVYASCDGYQIWLHLNDHRSPGLIALDRVVIENLLMYAKIALGVQR